MDNNRCGTLPFVFDDDFGFDRYVEYALDVPMYFVYRCAALPAMHRHRFDAHCCKNGTTVIEAAAYSAALQLYCTESCQLGAACFMVPVSAHLSKW